ncbi:hypothetical protein U1Q18_008189 [Sarracenia purpurea var. burkii]
MKARFSAVIQLHFLFRIPGYFPLAFDSPTRKAPILKVCQHWITFASASITTTPVLPLGEKVTVEVVGDCPKDSADVLRKWGCSDSDISKIFLRRPSLRDVYPANLQSKLNLLRGLGLSSSDLVQIINCRPRFLSNRISWGFDERLEYLQALFGSKEVLLKAITRNPSLLTYDFHDKIKPVIATYDEMGVSRKDLITMLLARPTVIPRTSLNSEKLDYISKTGVSKDSKMYKYVVTMIAISRIDTIREKLANLEKFGFTEDEVWGLFGRSPLILTLSIDKIQRNMTFILGTMKLPAHVVLGRPFLLFSNLDTVLKPRVLLAGKIQDMGLAKQIKGPVMLTALRMKEKRFVEAFIKCHPNEVADELMEFYSNAKDVKRLAESSKKISHKGFPF